MIRILLLIILLLAGVVGAEERFPPPEFTTSGYQLPATTTPAARNPAYDYLDIGILFAALVGSSYLVLRRRSRRGIYWLGLASVAYFGFWREGCVCSIGSIQNVCEAAVTPAIAVPATVLAFFFLPLLFTLLFGRTFCAAVCPQGMLQDAVLCKPLQIPLWLDHALGLLAYIYLGLAVLFAATGSAYVICDYDPFISLFRRSGSTAMLLLGGAFLVVGMVWGRPYCRYLCPYGAILRLLSRLSRWRVTIYSDRCVDCRLCEVSCPYGAIRKPLPFERQPPRNEGKWRLVLLLALLPIQIFGGGWMGSELAGPLSRMHRVVRLADQYRSEEEHKVAEITDDSKAFRASGRGPQALFAEAETVYRSFKIGGWWFGAWVGLVLGCKLISLSVRRRRNEFEADRAACLACGRCYAYCPGTNPVETAAMGKATT